MLGAPLLSAPLRKIILGRYDDVTEVPSSQVLHEYVIANAPLFLDGDFGRECAFTSPSQPRGAPAVRLSPAVATHHDSDPLAAEVPV